MNSANEVTIVDAGAIPPLVELLRAGLEEGKTNAAGALANVAVSDANRVTIAQAGAIPSLVELLRTGPEGV